MKRKSNIITTLALICAIIMITLLPLPVAQAASFTVSKTKVSLETGKTSAVVINASTHTGRLDIISSNSNVATVDVSNIWVENNSKTITISGKSTGTATITIKGELYDASTEEEAEFIKTINVTVTKTANSGSSNTGGNLGTNSETNTGGTGNNAGTGSGDAGNNVGTGSESTGNNTSTGGNTSNSNQTGSSNNSTSNSGGQSISTTTKPSITTKPSASTTSKPTNSNSSNNTVVQSATQNNSNENSQETNEEAINDINSEETINNAEVIPQEDGSAEKLQNEQDVDVMTETQEINNNIQEKNNRGKLIIAGIALIAVAITGLGIFITKKI